MLQQIIESIVGLGLLGVVVLFALSLLSPFGVLWFWPGPRREERSERVTIINNTPPAPAQPAGPSAWTLLAPAVAALLVALTHRVESQQQALPAPSDEEWVEIEPGRWVRTRQTALVRQDGYRG